MNQKIQVFVNGTQQSIDENETLRDVLENLHLRSSGFAVAVNEAFVPRSRYEEFVVMAHDKIEIVSPMVGG